MNKAIEIFLKNNIKLIDEENYKELFKKSNLHSGFTSVDVLKTLLNLGAELKPTIKLPHYTKYIIEFLSQTLVFSCSWVTNLNDVIPDHPSDIDLEKDKDLIDEVLRVSLLLGFQPYKTSHGYWGTEDILIIEPTENLNNFVKENSDEYEIKDFIKIDHV